MPRGLKEIDADIRQARARQKDTVRGTATWSQLQKRIDDLLDERNAEKRSRK